MKRRDFFKAIGGTVAAVMAAPLARFLPVADVAAVSAPAIMATEALALSHAEAYIKHITYATGRQIDEEILNVFKADQVKL